MKWPIGFNSPRYTQSKDLEKAYINHQKRLATMNANVDNKPPKLQRGSNAKMVKATKARHSKIYHDNMVLLKRLNDQFSRKSPSFSAPPYRMNRNTFSEHRMRQEKQIETDNQFILKRINENARISHYSREKMAREELKRERVLGIMCHFRGVPRSVSPSRIANFQKKSASAGPTSTLSASSPGKQGNNGAGGKKIVRPVTAPESKVTAPKSGKENQRMPSIAQQKKLASQRPVTAGPYRLASSQKSDPEGSVPRTAKSVNVANNKRRDISTAGTIAASGSNKHNVDNGQITYYHGETKSLVQVPSPYSSGYAREKARSEVKSAF